MITFFALASRCLAASSRLVKKPVDSMTTSAPRSPHGSAAGSRSASTLTSRPSMASVPSRTSTVPGKGPKTESYLSRCPSVPASVMSFTATISMSASDSCAARNTLRPMRPKPLIPTRTDMKRSLSNVAIRCGAGQAIYRRISGAGWARVRSSAAAHRNPVDIPVLDLDEVLAAAPERRRQVLGDRDRAVPAAGAADRDHEVRLPFGHVLREQVLEQRQHVVVELLQPAVATDVVDDPLVEPGERAQVRLVVRVGQEADVEREVGVARRTVLVAERRERDGEAAGRAGLEQL